MNRNLLACTVAVLMIFNFVISGQLMAASDGTRFFFSGDGKIVLSGEKSGESFSGQYRHGQSYDPAAMAAISGVFGAPYSPDRNELSLRLIEFLDLIQDRLAPGKRISITSGYRSPTYNTSLRSQGKLAAKASLHQYGMAADLKIEGVPARRIWEYVKDLGFGGTGYYHGETVHIDVGPARSWDEKTSGVGTGISEDNKLIGIVTDFDRYQAGETVTLRFIRMTAFPIGVRRQFDLVHRDDKAKPETEVTRFEPSFTEATESECPRFSDIDQMARIRWQIPADMSPGRYTIRTRFCGVEWNSMPSEITTPEFEINRL
jgi:uncharacterized protein YcbK (DUF882 family)